MQTKPTLFARVFCAIKNDKNYYYYPMSIIPVLRLRLVFSSAHIKILLLESLFFSLLRHTTLRCKRRSMFFSARLVTTRAIPFEDPGRSRSKRAGGVSAASGTSSGVEGKRSHAKVIVKVQPTQTLSDVSKENEVSVRDIVRLNGLGTRRTLRVGEELIVSDFSGEEEDVKVIERAELLTVKTKTKEKEKKTDNTSSTILVPQNATTSIPFTTSFGVGVGAAVLSMALVSTNIGRSGKKEDEDVILEETRRRNRSGSTSTSSNDSNSDRSGNRNNSSFPVQEEVVETVGVEKEVEEKITVQPAAVEVAPSSSSSPAPLERLKGWMDERDMEENFESSIEEFKAKLAAAQDALIVLQDQMERSKRNKNNQKW